MTKISLKSRKVILMVLVLFMLFPFGAIVLNGRGFNLIDAIPFGLGRNMGGGNSIVRDNDRADVKKSSVFKEVIKPVYLSPIKIQFKEKILQVEEINVEEGGFLGVPSSWQTAGWYKEGAKPGEEGNVIIDGHYDTNTGAPGAFWELKDLQVGDKVLLTDKLGRVFTYSVNGKSFISIADPERSKVFASGKDKELTLITCGGVWDYTSGTYNKRLVIAAVFDKMEKSW
ncbi:MAG: class F sortase [Patescibacteria group bacterium]